MTKYYDSYSPYPNNLFKEYNLNPYERAVFMEIYSCYRSFGACSWSSSTIADNIGVGLNTVKRSVKRLSDLGFIIIENRKGSTNELIPNIRYNKGAKMVVLSNSENTNPTLRGSGVDPVRVGGRPCEGYVINKKKNTTTDSAFFDGGQNEEEKERLSSKVILQKKIYMNLKIRNAIEAYCRKENLAEILPPEMSVPDLVDKFEEYCLAVQPNPYFKDKNSAIRYFEKCRHKLIEFKRKESSIEKRVDLQNSLNKVKGMISKHWNRDSIPGYDIESIKGLISQGIGLDEFESEIKDIAKYSHIPSPTFLIENLQKKVG